MTQNDTSSDQAKSFYDREYAQQVYAAAETHAEGLPELTRFVADYALADKKCVEFGCGRGMYQDLVTDYTGTDLSPVAGQNLRKTFVACSITELPFPESTFDGGWSIWVLEHVPEVEKGLEEIRRVMKSGGVAFLTPAWQCRPWAADGYPVRPYSDFGLGGKIYKALIPLRDSVAWRSLFIFPRRLWRLAAWKLGGGPTRFLCGKLKPNYEKFWMSDSDAVNSMDPYEMIVWFRSRGDEVLHPPTPLRQFLVRNGPIIVRVRK